MADIKKAKLTDFTPDPNNANKGTERGRFMLERSLTELGAGRSIVSDKYGVIIAGNKSLETAVESGFEDAIVVETDGTKLVVVKRTDLDLATDEKAKKLAIADNRTGQISLSWQTEVLADLNQQVDLSGFFTKDELKGLFEEDDNREGDRGNRGKEPKEVYCVCPECQYRFVQQV